jgi:hypothetical protein
MLLNGHFKNAETTRIGEEVERAYGLLQHAVDSQIVHSGFISE